MTEDTIAWLQGANGRSILVTVHIAGMMLVSCAAVVGYGICARLLYWRGPRPGRVFTRFIHGVVAAGVLLLWLSGGGLAAGSIVVAEVPPQMMFKLGVAVILSMSVWAEQIVVLPLMYSRRRPLAASLGWGELLGIIVVVSVSVSCWVMLVANSFSQEMQAIPYDQLFGLLGKAVGLLSVTSFLIALIVRLRMPKGGPAPGKRTKSRGRRMRLAAAAPTSRPPPARAELSSASRTSDVRPLPSRVEAPPPRVVAPQPVQAPLGYRLRPSNANDGQQLRDKLAQEWSRCARPRVRRLIWNEAQAQRDDHLLHDWLRRSG